MTNKQNTVTATMKENTEHKGLELWPQEGGWLPLLYYAGFIPFALLAVVLCVTLTKNWRV